MKIKKSFEDIVTFLEANSNKKVESILEEVYSMVESKKQQKASIKDKDGNVLAIFCYYHKQWEIVKDVEYGSKVNSTTGLNTMCKVGTSKWTKQQRDSKKAKEQLLEDVSSGKVLPTDILKHQKDIEEGRNIIDETDMPKGYASEVEVKKALNIK